MSRIDQMAGNLFYRGVSPKEILGLGYHELVYFNEWHERIEKAEADAYKVQK